MPTDPLHKYDAGTLDETIIRPEASVGRFGWRWLLSCLYLVLLTVLIVLMLWPANYTNLDPVGLTRLLRLPDLLFVLVPLLASGLFFFRVQSGWVLGTILVSAAIVVSALGFLAQFMPTIEPVDDFRSARMATSCVSLLLACSVLYLLSHPTLRAGFRIPNSWIQRCITLGGLVGTSIGVWLLYLTGLFGRL